MRQPLNYKNGKIYVIRNHINDKVYVGSTTQALSKRFSKHKGDHKSKKTYEYPIYKAMREIGVENFYIELVENYPCKNIDQLNAREGYHIRQYDSFKNGYNGKIEGRTDQECKKEWYQRNRETIILKTRQYRTDNKDKINEQRNQKIVCECGSVSTKRNLLRHKKSPKHQNYLSSIINSSGNAQSL